MSKKNIIFFVIYLFVVFLFFLNRNEDKSIDSLNNDFLLFTEDDIVKKYGLIYDNNFKNYKFINNLDINTSANVYIIDKPDIIYWERLFTLFNEHFFSSCEDQCNYNLKLVNNNSDVIYSNDSGVEFIINNDSDYGFGITDENNRPGPCTGIGNNSCKYDESTGGWFFDFSEEFIDKKDDMYYKQIMSFMKLLNLNYDYDIIRNYSKSQNSFSYNVIFKKEGYETDDGWFFDFSSEGPYSFQGFFNKYTLESSNYFKSISLNKSLENYKNNNHMYNLIPDLKFDGSVLNNKLISNNNLTISSASLRYKKNILNDKIYLLPYYHIETDQGNFYILAVEVNSDLFLK